jgi:hypothetical protein
MRIAGFVLPAACLMMLIFGCHKDPSPPNFHFDYFPTGEGRFVTYTVREVHIDDDLLLNDTIAYYMKTVIGDTITDNEGRLARRFERYVKDSLHHPWVLQDIWTTIIDGNRAELIEENQRTIKMVFSPSKYKEWNCNAYNMLDPLDCYYRDIHLASSINGFSFDSTVTVEQQDFTSSVDHRRMYEQYAKGVGMYYKHYKDYRLEFHVIPDTLDVEKGNEIIMRLIDYGVE